MKVRALCGIFYNGELYSRGDIIEVPRVIANTVIVPNNETSEEVCETDAAPPEEDERRRPGRKRGGRND